MEKDITKDPIVMLSTAGRNFDEQVADIRKDGVFGRPPALRYFALKSMGLGKPKEKAENVICFGCYPPFSRFHEVENYLKVFNRLGIDYTWLDKEYCCALGLVERSKGADKERGKKEAANFIGMNLAAARERGAKTIVYLCNWCIYMARYFAPQKDIAQAFVLDILVDKLAQRHLEVKPATVAYFEGCHVRAATFAPGVKLDWPAYRKMLGAVEGLQIVDLPRSSCCMNEIDKIAGEIQKRNLTTVVTPCTGCSTRLKGLERFQVKTPIDILAEAMGD